MKVDQKMQKKISSFASTILRNASPIIKYMHVCTFILLFFCNVITSSLIILISPYYAIHLARQNRTRPVYSYSRLLQNSICLLNIQTKHRQRQFIGQSMSSTQISFNFSNYLSLLFIKCTSNQSTETIYYAKAVKMLKRNSTS